MFAEMGFHRQDETAKAVEMSPRGVATQLKLGVNEKVRTRDIRRIGGLGF
jgi:hypothetical protein